MMHPVGPHDSQTYWLRRTLVAVVIVALLVGVVWWALGRGSGPGADTAAVTTSETTTPSLTGVLATDLESGTVDPLSADTLGGDAAAGSTGDSSATPTGLESDVAATASAQSTGTVLAGTGSSSVETTPTLPPVKSTVPGGSVVGTTNPAAVTVTVTKQVPATGTATKTAPPKATAPPKPSYDSAGRLICPATSIGLTGVVWGTVAGQQPRLGMNVTNIGKQACQQDVSGAAQTFTVLTAAGDHVWSTADCFPGEGQEVRALAVGSKASYVILWSGTTSAPGCNAPRVKVKAGKYKLVVQLGALKSKALPFTMH